MFKIEIDYEEFVRDLKREERDFRKKAANLINKYIAKIYKDAKKFAYDYIPKRVGPNYRSVNLGRMNIKNATANSLYGEVATNTEYAEFQEVGFTKRNGDWWEGKHYMERAFNKHKNKFKKELNNLRR